MNDRDRQRLDDIADAIAAIHSHLECVSCPTVLSRRSSDLLLGIGQAVKSLPAEVLDAEPGIPWTQMARMRDHLAHRYFDTSHAVIQHTVDHDLAEFDAAVGRLRGTSG